MTTTHRARMSASIALLLLGGFGCADMSAKTKANADGAKSDAVVEEYVTSRILDLRGKKLTVIPDEVLHNIRLEELDASDNLLEGTLSAEVGRLRRLKVLRVASNELTGVPPEIGRLRELEVLDLSRNRIIDLPREIADIRDLRELNVAGNPYSEEDLRAIADRLPGLKIIK